MSGRGELYVEGWILHFFGIYEKCDITEIPHFAIDVPIKLINQWTKETKDLELSADWISVSMINETTYKPDLGLCITRVPEPKQ